MRSPNYPALGLSDAISRVDSLWREETRTPVPPDVAARAMGFGALSGPSRTAMGALKKYGLLDSADGNMRVSDLALRILHPADADDKVKALQEAALRPELFQQLHQSHLRASDTALTSHLINKLGFSTTGSKQVIKAFRDAMELANLNQTEYIPSAVASVAATVSSQTMQPNDVVSESDSSQAKHLHSWSWPLSIPRNVRAELKITGHLTLADVQRLKKQVENLEGAFDDDSKSTDSTN